MFFCNVVDNVSTMTLNVIMYSYIHIFNTNNIFTRVCQCDLSYQTKCTKRTGIIRLVGCRQSCKSFFI